MLTSSQLSVTVTLTRTERFVWDNVMIEQITWRVQQPVSRVVSVRGEGFYDGKQATARMPLDRLPGRVREAMRAELDRASRAALSRA